MKVHEFIEWLQKFEDQGAEVEIVVHRYGGYLGGQAAPATFDPSADHFDYVDFRDNDFVSVASDMYNKRFLLLGVVDG